MTYPPLADVRKTLRVEWYRSPIEHATFRELSKRSDLQGWWQAVGHLALFAITGSLTFFLWAQQQWIGFVVLLFFHGTVASFFVGVPSHELGHGTVFRTKKLNKLFLYLFSLLGWFDTFDYNTSHTFHHRYTLHPEGDREVLLPIKPTAGKTFLLQLFTINILTKRGRTLGNGIVGRIYTTFKASLGKDSASEWINALHIDQPDQHKKFDVVGAGHADLPRLGACDFNRHRPLDFAPDPHIRPVHRELGQLLCAAPPSTAA